MPLACILLVSCSQPAPQPRPEPGSAPAPGPAPGDPPPADVADTGPKPTTPGYSYQSDCSLTHPVAHDPCSGPAPATRGLPRCAAIQAASGQGCHQSAPGCYVERQCPDGRSVAGDFLVCVKERPGRCMMRSSRRFKKDVRYLSAGELRDLARQIEALPLARYRYTEETDGERLGFLVEDAPAAPFIEGGSAVDVYELLAASIAAIQTQDERIRALEARLRSCPAR